MGFKVNRSFLRFLRMGAAGVRSTIRYFKQKGFEPLELERYCASNKIWVTKVKRLRLPDLLCARTGLRVEVRTKSNLKIRMSDAPNNPDRRWDVGLRDDDIVAFVTSKVAEQVEIIGNPVCFLVRDLRSTVKTTKLGPPKSASEGAERDREWKSTVPLQDGEVLEVTTNKIVTQLDSGRRQTYQLRDKSAYVSPGDRFIGGATIIAGTVPHIAPLATAIGKTWDPIATLQATNEVDRYAAAKAIAYRGISNARVGKKLLAAMKHESDDRVALEMAASAARLGMKVGLDCLSFTIWNHERGDLRMEAVLILTELGTADAAAVLEQVATSPDFEGDELRQTATWGLGREGCRAYDKLINLIGDEDDAVALHAIAAFESDASETVVSSLVEIVRQGDPRRRAASSAALRLIGSHQVLRSLIEAARTHQGKRPWILATLGQLAPEAIRAALAGDPLLAEVEPLMVLGPTENWLAKTEASENLRFLLLQRSDE